MTSNAALLVALPGIVKPAGAAAAGEVLAATAIGAALSGTLLLVAWAHRTRRTTLLMPSVSGTPTEPARGWGRFLVRQTVSEWAAMTGASTGAVREALAAAR